MVHEQLKRLFCVCKILFVQCTITNSFYIPNITDLKLCLYQRSQTTRKEPNDKIAAVNTIGVSWVISYLHWINLNVYEVHNIVISGVAILNNFKVVLFQYQVIPCLLSWTYTLHHLVSFMTEDILIFSTE